MYMSEKYLDEISLTLVGAGVGAAASHIKHRKAKKALDAQIANEKNPRKKLELIEKRKELTDKMKQAAVHGAAAGFATRTAANSIQIGRGIRQGFRAAKRGI